MGLKKYEIITVGSDKRVRALRSWAVGDRYVNIGDVGGIVYDEKTLSQDGACWLFNGNFGFPGARIGGDSIVDVGETGLSNTGTPNVDILGSSVVVGSKLQFASDQTAVDAVVLTAADFEQGRLVFAVGQPITRSMSSNSISTKAPIFMGGSPVTIKADVPGFTITALVCDRDGIGTDSMGSVNTAEGITITVPEGQYFYLSLSKNPIAAIVPADATAAQITFTGIYELKLSIVDSRVEVNPANATGTTAIIPGGVHIIAPGVKYPDSVIRNSKVVINSHATANRIVRLMSEFIGCNVAIDATLDNAQSVGIYSNVNNLTFTGAVSANGLNVNAYNSIQVTDCDNFSVSPTIFPGLAAAQTANMPFIFQGCNVPDGRFYHHAQIANTYKNIDFAKASVDLGKMTPGGPLVSSEVEGMYRLFRPDVSVLGGLVESYESVKSLTSVAVQNSYGTTIYKDAYFTGLFDFAGTNVFGNKVRSHPLAQVLNVAPRAVQGTHNATTIGETITGLNASTTIVCVPIPFRVAGGKGITVLTPPAGLQVLVILTDINNKVITNTGWVSVETNLTPVTVSTSYYAYISVRKTALTALNPSDVAGTQIVTYNGCKIVNTGETAIPMKGNIRVEDNATLVNVSITGTGYFGGNSVAYHNPAVWAALDFNGAVCMRDNAVFAPSALTGASALVMEGNAKFTGSADEGNTYFSLTMGGNAFIEGRVYTRSGVIMSGNAKVAATGQISSASRGVLIMEENASIEANTTVIGAITLSGNYKGNVVKTWTGKRTITDINAPKYDNNVKTQYDF